MTIQTPIDTIEADPAPRRATVGVDVGGVLVGGGAPVVVQSMTNTDTADIDATVAQVAALSKAGSEIVRITVDRDESAAAVPKVRERLERLGLNVPLVVRLAGTNVEAGKEILAQSGLPIIAASDLGDAAAKIVKAVREAA